MAPRGRRGRVSASQSGSRGRNRAPVEREENVLDSKESSSSTSESEQEGEVNTITSTSVMVHDQTFYKAEDMPGKKKGKKKSSLIWDYGYEVIHSENKGSYYYCKLCLDDKKDVTYTPLSLNGMSSVLSHFRAKHGDIPDTNRDSIERTSSA